MIHFLEDSGFRLYWVIIFIFKEREAQELKIKELEEEVTDLHQNYTALLREKELLFREKLKTEQVMLWTSQEAVNLETVSIPPPPDLPTNLSTSLPTYLPPSTHPSMCVYVCLYVFTLCVWMCYKKIV